MEQRSFSTLLLVGGLKDGSHKLFVIKVNASCLSDDIVLGDIEGNPKKDPKLSYIVASSSRDLVKPQSK